MNRDELADYFHMIANGKLETNIVLQDSFMTAILDIDPINVGHVLILPKTKKQEFLELDDNELLSLTSMVRKVSKAINEIYSPQGISLMQNGGANSELNYFHFHVFPRFEGDGFNWISNEVKKGSLKTHLEKFKKYFI